tara:strand:- start:943 stop:1317 length:375 start_codon:yes stop_codon:yes gene_type:complete
MLYIVLATMLMYLIHLILPTLLTFKNNPDFSNVRQLIERDTNIPNYVVRIHAATENLKESLPVFFACAVLSIVTGVDSSGYGLTWIILRIAYVVCYVYKLNPYRSIVWMGSIFCLVLMGINLIQ